MMNNTDYQVHESSYIDDGVEIGVGTCIWHFCHIMTGVTIGRDCRLGQNVVVGPRATVGDNVKIQNNVSVYEGVTLEDHVFCGPSVVFTNVQTPRSAFPRNTSVDFAPTRIKTGASLGANATIVCGNTVGRHALVGAGAVVTREVPDYGVVYGNPARLNGWACECGEILELVDDRSTCSHCGRQYQTLSDSTLSRMPEFPSSDVA